MVKAGYAMLSCLPASDLVQHQVHTSKPVAAEVQPNEPNSIKAVTIIGSPFHFGFWVHSMLLAWLSNDYGSFQQEAVTMVSFRSSYHPIDAAILWCDLADHESEILQVELSDPGGLLKHFPQWPTLHLYAERICDAIIYGELPATYLGGPIGLTDPVPRAYWSIRHPDLCGWFARTYPHEKPAFLFSRESDHSLCVSLGVHLALQADRDVLLRELENLRRTYSALCDQVSPELDDPTKAKKSKSKSGVLSENAALLLYVIVGALLALMLGKSEKGLPRSIFDDQAAIVDAMTTLFPGVRGLKKRTLDRKFAEARRRFAQAGRA